MAQGGEAITMTAVAAEKVVRRMTKAHDDLDGALGDVTTLRDLLEGGSGEFSTQMSHGADVFEISWKEFFDVTGDSARQIIAKTQSAHSGLQAIDLKHTPTR